MDPVFNILDLGMSRYEDAWDLQKELQSQRISGQIISVDGNTLRMD